MKTLLLILFLLSFDLHAQLLMSPASSSAVTAGEVVEVDLELSDRALMDELSPQRLQEAFVPEALWFMSVETWQLTAAGLRTKARVVLGKKFQPAATAALMVNNRSVELKFAGWNFSAGKETDGPFIYQEVPWYFRPWWKTYGWPIVAGALLLGTLGINVFLRFRKKKQLERLALDLRDSLLKRLEEARDMTTLSQAWGARDEFTAVFPGREQSLRNFFDVLNQYQFKPRHSGDELSEVLTAKKKLLDELRGGVRGV